MARHRNHYADHRDSDHRSCYALVCRRRRCGNDHGPLWRTARSTDHSDGVSVHCMLHTLHDLGQAKARDTSQEECSKNKC